MYNGELKERFIASYTEKISVGTFCRRLFEFTKPYEEKWGADLCTRGSKDIEMIVEESSGTSSQSLSDNLRTIKQYIRWCVSQGIPNACEEALEIKSVTSNKIKTTTVTNPAHFQRYLNIIFDDEDMDTMDIVFRTYYWLAYAGMRLDDIFKVKKSDISLEDMTVKYGDMCRPIYRESLKTIRKCIALDSVNVFRPNKVDPVVIERVDSDLLLRGTRGVLSKKTTLESISRKQRAAIDSGKTNMRVGFFGAWISGLFFRIYMDELSGIPADFSKFVEMIDAVKENGSEKRKPVNQVLRNRIIMYQEDYLTWKDSLNK